MSNLSIAALRAEIQKRLDQLPGLIKQRDALDAQIAELESFAGVAREVAGKGSKPGPQGGRKAGAKAKAAPVAKKTSAVAKAPAKAARGKARSAKPQKAAKWKRTFKCPTCGKAFVSGVALGGHYKAEPSHRKSPA